MNIKAIKTDLFTPNQNLEAFLTDHISALPNQSVVVIASKIIALSEGRVIACHSKEEKHQIAREESEFYLDSKWIPLTIKDGLLMMAAGIDESNVGNTCLLLPKNPFDSAQRIRSFLMDHFKLSQLGIIVSDSRLFPLRQGVTGCAIGYAGFHGLKDYRGTKDLHGRTFTMESLNIADCLASAAIVEMGEGAEQQPLAIITDTTLEWTDQQPGPEELRIAKEDDLYAPLFKAFD